MPGRPIGGSTTTDQPPSRIVIEDVWPEIDGGRHPIKRIVGETLEVWADIFRDGHDKLSACLKIKAAGIEQSSIDRSRADSSDNDQWIRVPMHLFDNDRWVGRVALETMGETRYTVEAWTDHFASWLDEVGKKRAAGQPVGLELAEGRRMIEEAAERAAPADRRELLAVVRMADAAATDDVRADILLAPPVAQLVARAPDRSDLGVYEPELTVVVDRPAARFASWYEMFPRSQGTVPGRHATFLDCAARLPEIEAMGFDVVYFVPIHPIGRTNRKGPGNSLVAGPNDPGSPYAIGGAEGGHTALHPEFGTLDDFGTFLAAAHCHGMEVALDFAVQCSPDHPWLREHPNWFKYRSDGSIKFAENPPKKYEDIVNLEFDQPDWRGLWAALRDAVLFWADQGVRLFRVDNPHTKPTAFWAWLIHEVQARYPDALFLAEAFTRPKMMKHLAKIGFSQSYTYFTWRNTKAELVEYMTELTQTPMAEYYRPHFFANTPDILPAFLQTGGRPAFRIRLVLAATLSPLYGIYNGFELCENAAVPSKEEYAESEKYDYKVWDWDRPGNIKQDIARLNALRRSSPALQLLTNLTFYPVAHEQVLCYGKATPDGTDKVLVVVNLDPGVAAECVLDLPADLTGDLAAGPIEVEEVLTATRATWREPRLFLTLDPFVNPAMVFRVHS
ncbi:MAG TPA: alpha-1,4-glucan--maltose-1-phosphate maltosyltransferase [Stellaceae bacterium]|nr:alpha-1,4-glucan--maltose-1-phosphate maltosyltransferase [Stellaceae bacterium]